MLRRQTIQIAEIKIDIRHIWNNLLRELHILNCLGIIPLTGNLVTDPRTGCPAVIHRKRLDIVLYRTDKINHLCTKGTTIHPVEGLIQLFHPAFVL